MSIPGNANPLLLASADTAAAAVATKSLRFNSGDSAYLNRTPSSAGNRKTWTWSGWIKRNKLGSDQTILEAYTAQTDTGYIQLKFRSADSLSIAGWSTNWKITTQVFRDVSAWMHLVVAFDVTQATGSDRIKFYVNGQQITDFGTDSAPSQNTDHAVNNSIPHYVGYSDGNSGQRADFMLADVYLIDGSALDATSFGAYDDNGVWQAAEYSGTFGTNGFHLLDFANESTVGHDSSGNENDFTANNISGSENPVYSRTAASSITNPANIFDGSTSTGGYSSSTGTNITLTTSSFTISTQLRVYNNFRSDGTYAICLNGTCVAVAGSGTDSTQYRYSTVDLSSFTLPLTVTSLGYSASQTSGNTLRAIEVDSTVLVDGTPSNLDVLFDVPTNGTQSDTGAGGEVSGNYCVLNPLDNGSQTLSNGNLDIEGASGAWRTTRATVGLSSGKWYWEFLHNFSRATSSRESIVGIAKGDATLTSYLGSDANGWGYYDIAGNIYNNGSGGVTSVSYDNGDVIGIAFDADNGKLYFSKNGTFINSGDPAAGTGAVVTGLTSGPYFPAFAFFGTGTNSPVNFGQRAFAYTAPTNFKPICTTNLPTPTVADGSTVMDIVLYAGNNDSPRDISGLSFQPDWVWIKSRTSGAAHAVGDSVRGANKNLLPNETSDEATGLITGFNSDGFEINRLYDGATNGTVNGSGHNFVAWCWDAGTSTVSNTDGSITSQVRANQTAGFSIVTYTGTGTAPSTVGHGLGAAPSFIFFKRRDTTSNWITYNSSIGAGKYLVLNDTTGAVTDSGPFNNTAATSTVFTINTFGDLNANGGTYVAYCISPVAGYSAVGSYTGTGSINSTPNFIYTGFRPRFWMHRRTDSAGSWMMLDAARDPYNVVGDQLYANLSNAEGSGTELDFLSNGVRMRASGSDINGSGVPYIYMCFAENPFQANGGLAR